MAWRYLSFTDPARPKGQQWLGALIIEADGIEDAVTRAWTIGQNPGGEVLCRPMERVPPAEFRGRLLNQDDLRAVSRALGGAGQLRRGDGRIV